MKCVHFVETIWVSCQNTTELFSSSTLSFGSTFSFPSLLGESLFAGEYISAWGQNEIERQTCFFLSRSAVRQIYLREVN
jgi:hypothetical protein